ncbi:Gp138 family membrane-puncturing spike protein [Pseudomonas sp. GV071]|uniref:Gp138 family membrane-puncturing spike protein n=1 Tax=Pseudomonas sp. GV071 TaxID=2135754 RepID=UPI000D4814AE|nr:Gp138 family membrane-puncturing spike protein [Pseudomonas sp. GV071]PTQ70286.1 hypothetical protein C8K61_1068 [Pseudomonas sp. GV071]
MVATTQAMDGATGVVQLYADASEYEVQQFLLRQALASTRTTTLVQVLSCSNNGGVSAVGFVDVKVLVQRVDGVGNVIDAGVIHDVPYLRLQGGSNAVIIDPQPGDIGLACIADRDLSAVKASKAAAAPGSARRHDMADALYIGGVLNGVPQQYVQFNQDGITLLSPTQVTIKAPVTAIEGDLTVSGSATVQGDVRGAGVSLAQHLHPGVQRGPANTDPPTPS